MDVSVRPGAEAVELIQTVNKQKKQINRRRGFHIRGQPAPEFRWLRPLEPQNTQQKYPRRDQVEAGGEAGNQVQSQSRRTDYKSAPAPAAQPFVLKDESGERQQEDVVVFHQVLGVVQVGGAE